MSANTATTKAQIEYIPMVVQALRKMDGSSKAAAVKEWIADRITASGKEVSDTMLASGASKFANDIQWARMYLVNAGILETVEKAGRGTWKLTPEGWELPLDNNTGQKIYAASTKQATSDNQDAPADDDKQDELPSTKSWESELVSLLPKLDPTGFERLCALIMGKGGVEAKATGKTGDGGVDGEGLLPVGAFDLVKMKVAWQCKRFDGGSVGSADIRDFRGAIDGRADFGVFFATSVFTTSAISEATRIGAIPIQLVDLKTLIALLRKASLGIVKKPGEVEEWTVDLDFFEEYKNPKGISTVPQQQGIAF